MHRVRIGLAFGMLLWIASSPANSQQGSATVRVYKDPTCGCCEKWVEHLRAAGFVVTVLNTADVTAVKDKHRVPKQARSCHTGVVNGYAIEGHVPAADVRRFLTKRPAGALGLAVPGMPLGSPGMEVPGGTVQPYDVLAFDKNGRTSAFASYGR
jgi:hypothetical protein